MKTICFDIRALQIGHEKRGIGMYIKSVLESLPSDENKYLLYTFEKNNPIKDLGINLNINYELIQTKTIKTKLETPRDLIDAYKLARHSFNPIKEHHPDVFMQFDFNLGIPKWKSIKTIVIGYDLIPLVLKRKYLPDIPRVWVTAFGKKAKLKSVLRAFYYKSKYKKSYKVYKKCDQIISISENTKTDFIKYLDINPDKIKTIPLAPVFNTQLADISVLKKIKRPYVFYVGGTDVRKRIKDIVYAFNVIRGRGIKISLVLAGNEFVKLNEIPDDEAREAIRKSAFSEDIHLIGFIDDSEKKALYENAHAFIFTSIYEGFGLPIIEAMATSCPVIAYNNSSIPEASGDSALLTENGNYLEIATQIAKLKDIEFRKKVIERGIRQASKFSWERYIKELKEFILS